MRLNTGGLSYFWQQGQWQSPVQHGHLSIAAIEVTAPPTRSANASPRLITIFFISILLF